MLSRCWANEAAVEIHCCQQNVDTTCAQKTVEIEVCWIQAKNGMLKNTDMWVARTYTSRCRIHNVDIVHIENHLDILDGILCWYAPGCTYSKGWSTIVNPMAEDSETCIFWCTRAAVNAGVAARLLQAAGETVCLWLQWRLRCWMPSPACWRCRCRVSVETCLVNMFAGLSFVWILISLT